MTLKEKITKLANEKSNPSVTLSLNTHRTHPDSLKDEILLKNLLNEAEKRVIDEFGKREVAPLLEKIGGMLDKIDINYNTESLHIFLSNDTEEIVRTTWPVAEDRANIADSFDLRPLIKAYNRSEEYLILLLSQGGVHLYEALNDSILEEIKNEDFPFAENPNYFTNAEERSDARKVDDQIREYFNDVDKAVVRVYNDTGLPCIVISTEPNFSLLRQVADKPDIYVGYADIDHNNTKPHQLAEQAWVVIRNLTRERRTEAISEMKEAVGSSLVLTDLQDIYQAAIDGRGNMLIVYEEFSQPVIMEDERTFRRVEKTDEPDVIDDITSNIAWEVLSKGGRVYFTCQDEIKDLGEIVLKTRY